jgi:hypothetical protein
MYLKYSFYFFTKLHHFRALKKVSHNDETVYLIKKLVNFCQQSFMASAPRPNVTKLLRVTIYKKL